MILLRLAWWNLRGRRARVLLLIACIALAVAGRVGVGTLVVGVEAVAAREARGLLGGDLELASAADITGEQRTALAGVLPAGSVSIEIRTLVTMAGTGTTARPVDLRAVPVGYPLVGRLDASCPPEVLHDGAQALAQQDLFTRLGVEPGAIIRLGDLDVRLAGVLRDEPGLSASPFSPGPRVLVSVATLEATGLATHGARIRNTTLITIPDPLVAKKLARTVNKALGNPEDAKAPAGAMGPPLAGITVRTADDAQAQAGRFLDRFADYVRLTALVALLLGGVGVASLVRGQVVESLDDVAMLRVLGATPRQVQGIFLLQALILGLAGGLAGALLGAGGAAALTLALPDWGLTVGFDPAVVGGGLALGALTATVFALLPLAELRSITPLAILRRDHLAAGWRPGGSGSVFIALIVIAASLVLLAAWDSRSWTTGPALMGTVLVAAAALYGLGHLLLPLVGRLRPRATWLALAVGNLGRPGYRPVAALTAIGLAAFLGGALLVYRASLLAELDPAKRGGIPALFVIDLQVDQIEDFRSLLRERGLADATQLAPVVRARYRPKDADAAPGTRDAEQARFFRNREQNLSWRDDPGIGNRLIAGTWLDPHGTTIEASLEERFASRLGVGVGDDVTFDVQGVPVTAKVTSLRRVDWTTFRPNFFVLMTPSAISEAPQTWIASLPALPAAERASFQVALAKRFPGAVAFDVSEIVTKVLRLIDRLVLVIRLIALLALAAGLAVLIGMALATAASRRQDAALLLVLGARRRTLAGSVAAEFAIIGLLAAALGALLAVGGSWIVVGLVIGLDVTIPWVWLALLAGIVATGCAVTGAIACRGVWRVEPLAVLRSE